MEALTPASAGDLPPLGEMIVNDPFWRHPSGTLAREGVAPARLDHFDHSQGHLGRHVADAGFGGQPLVSQILMTACTNDLFRFDAAVWPDWTGYTFDAGGLRPEAMRRCRGRFLADVRGL
jgi:hypothetical protein